LIKNSKYYIKKTTTMHFSFLLLLLFFFLRLMQHSGNLVDVTALLVA